MNIGVIAFQGDFQRHLTVLSAIGTVSARGVRRPEDLDGLDGIIIPGGESTTIGMLMDRFGLLAAVRDRIREGLAAMGTCAGAILLAREIEASDQVRIGAVDMRVRRNAYGRQIDSFEFPLTIHDALHETIDGDETTWRDAPPVGVFIRAPRITAIGRDVTVLASVEDDPVIVRCGRILALTFHPELTGDTRIHRLFLSIIAGETRKPDPRL